jgi:DNA-binding transcriptional ArsR family regulator
MKDFVRIAKALADENRVRVLAFLAGGELCVCQVIEMLGLAPSTVSKHLAVLHQAGLVETRKQGRWIYYRLPRRPSPCAREAIRFVRSGLAGSEPARADAKRLQAVRKMSKDALCLRYKGCRGSGGGK